MDSSMDLKSMTLEELTDCVMELGEKKFRAKQIYGWLHQKLVRSPEEMKNVPAKCIEKLLKRASILWSRRSRTLRVEDRRHTEVFIFAPRW